MANWLLGISIAWMCGVCASNILTTAAAGEDTTPLVLVPLAVLCVVALIVTVQYIGRIWAIAKGARTHGFWAALATVSGFKSYLASIVVAVVTIAIWRTDAPLKLAVEVFRDRLDTFASRVGTSTRLGRAQEEQLIGVWRAKKVSTDSRGGIYILVVENTVFIMTTHYYGLAFRPNQEGSPYADEAYALRHLSGDWYAFSALMD